MQVLYFRVCRGEHGGVTVGPNFDVFSELEDNEGRRCRVHGVSGVEKVKKGNNG